jgi:hypothetical protein
MEIEERSKVASSAWTSRNARQEKTHEPAFTVSASYFGSTTPADQGGTIPFMRA